MNDPKYCAYHRLISHSLSDCFVLKDKIQELLDSKTIEIPPLEKTTSNPVTTMDDGVVYEDSRLMKEESSDEEWTIFESKGMKKRRKAALKASNKTNGDGAKTVSRKQRKSKDQKRRKSKLVKDKKKKEKKVKKEKGEKLVPTELLEQVPPPPITLEEYMPPELQSEESQTILE